MNRLRSFTPRLPVLLALLLPLLVLATGCARYNADGSLATWGIVLVILDIWAIITIWGKSWELPKKLIWTAIVFFFPFGGLLIYYFFGRNS